ncbi:MAG: lipocalin-like domain-containing protein [Solirubrobacterales bacterium]|nr:lipocalin-like domain-containing protein [Solirubrobacterales bacterium]
MDHPSINQEREVERPVEPSGGPPIGMGASAAPASSPDEVTRRSLEAYDTIEDPRVKHLIQGLIEHLHACVRDLKPTDEEWEFAWDFMERMARVTSPQRNEFLLLADVIGVSQLIETLAHAGPAGAGFALVGPFYREAAPFRDRGASTASDETPGDRVRIRGRVFDEDTKAPIAAAIIDTWQTATNGLYENQDPNQPDYNLRGRFRTDKDGSFEFVALLPTPYPVPTDGPVGELLRAAGRSTYRPAHIHMIVSAPGRETFVTQVFREGDPRIATDPVFTATRDNIGDFVQQDDGVFTLRRDFPMRPGRSTTPKAPIPAQRPSKETAAKQFLGTWRLVDEVQHEEGGPPKHVFGDVPIGYIHYDDTGLMSVQLGRRERSAGEAGARVQELEQEYHAYFGRYEVDSERAIVRHILEGQIVPGQYPDVVERRYRFSGDLLYLEPVEGAKRQVIWQRVAP